MTSSWCSEDTQTTYLTLQQLGHYSSNFGSQVYSHWKQTILMIYISAHETIFQLPDKCQAPYIFLYKIWHTHLQTMPDMSGTFCAHWYTEVIYSTTWTNGWCLVVLHFYQYFQWICVIFYMYRQSSNISCTWVGNINCWSLRCSWSIACRHCSHYIFILNLTPGFNELGKDNCKTRQESFKFCYLVHLI